MAATAVFIQPSLSTARDLWLVIDSQATITSPLSGLVKPQCCSGVLPEPAGAADEPQPYIRSQVCSSGQHRQGSNADCQARPRPSCECVQLTSCSPGCPCSSLSGDLCLISTASATDRSPAVPPGALPLRLACSCTAAGLTCSGSAAGVMTALRAFPACWHAEHKPHQCLDRPQPFEQANI